MIFWTTFGKIQGITFLLIYLTPTTSNQPQSQVTFLPLCASRGHQDGQLLSSFFAFQPLTWSMSLQFRWLQWWTRWKKKRNGRSEHFFSDCAVRVNMGYAPWHTSSDSTPPFLVVVPTTFHAPHVMSKHQRPTFCSSHGDKRAMLCDVPVCLRLHWIRTAKAGHWTSAKTKSNQKDFTKSRETGTSNELYDVLFPSYPSLQIKTYLWCIWSSQSHVFWMFEAAAASSKPWFGKGMLWKNVWLVVNLGIHLEFHGQRVLLSLFGTLLMILIYITYLSLLWLSLWSLLLWVQLTHQGCGGWVSSLELKTFDGGVKGSHPNLLNKLKWHVQALQRIYVDL